MTWLVWRQHRAQLYVGAALLVAFAITIVITGVQVANQYHAAQAACAAGPVCPHLGGLFLGNHAVGFLIIATLGAPALVGLFWGAPLIAAEAEAGTAQFAWMQSVTRKRWLAFKIGWILLAAAIWGGVISALVTWWEGPNNALQLDAFKPGRFDIMGVVPVAYSLYAVALGIAAGALTRRVVPAMAITLAGFIGVRSAIALYLRPHYMSAVTVFYKVTGGYTPPGSYWQVNSGVIGPNGQPVPQPNGVPLLNGIPLGYLPSSCVRAVNGPSRPSSACIQALSHYRGFLTYQPADRYWPFQGIESGIFLALAAVLVAVTAVVLLRRDV
jgi:hypothetical protein